MSKGKTAHRDPNTISDIDELLEDFYIMDACIDSAVDLCNDHDHTVGNGLHYQWQRFLLSVDKALKPKMDGARVSLTRTASGNLD